jgi:hypothetical protein
MALTSNRFDEVFMHCPGLLPHSDMRQVMVSQEEKEVEHGLAQSAGSISELRCRVRGSTSAH